MQGEGLDIGCKIFLQMEPKIKFLTDSINLAKSIDRKAQLAEQLSCEAKTLLNCKSYDEGRLDCTNCQTICSLRRKVATLILKTNLLVEA